MRFQSFKQFGNYVKVLLHDDCRLITLAVTQLFLQGYVSFELLRSTGLIFFDVQRLSKLYLSTDYDSLHVGLKVCRIRT